MKDDGCSREQLVLTKAEKKAPETSISKQSGIINEDTKSMQRVKETSCCAELQEVFGQCS